MSIVRRHSKQLMALLQVQDVLLVLGGVQWVLSVAFLSPLLHILLLPQKLKRFDPVAAQPTAPRPLLGLDLGRVPDVRGIRAGEPPQ